MQRHSNRFLLGALCVSMLLLLLIAACVPASPASPIQQTATALQGTFSSQFFGATQQSFFLTAQVYSGQQPFFVVTAGGMPPTQAPLGTLIALTAQPCVFVAFTQDLPEVTTAAQNAFVPVILLDDVRVGARAAGEQCLDPDGSVRYFAPYATDIFITANVATLSDLEPLAQLVLIAYDALTALNAKLVSPLVAFDLTLIAGDSVGNLRTTFAQIALARAEGFTGGALMDALGGVVQR